MPYEKFLPNLSFFLKIFGLSFSNDWFETFSAEGGPVEFSIPVPKYLQMQSGAAGVDDAIAPMTGTVTAVYSKAGDSVSKERFYTFQIWHLPSTVVSR